MNPQRKRDSRSPSGFLAAPMNSRLPPESQTRRPAHVARSRLAATRRTRGLPSRVRGRNARKGHSPRRLRWSPQRAAFLASPGGQAQSAFERGDRVFQFSHPMMSQTIVEIWATKTKKTTNDPSEILNAVSDQGWEIVSASFVFVEDTLESRDNTWKSGSNVKVKGDTCCLPTPHEITRLAGLRRWSQAGSNR